MNFKNKPNLENITVEVEKHQLEELSPDNFDEFLSIRNPAGFILDDKIGLLYTVRHKAKNNNETTKSYLHLAWSKDGNNFNLEKNPFIGLDPDSKEGVEDARISKINDLYYITFTAFKGNENGVNTTRIGLVTTKDFYNIKDRRIILDHKKNNKNALIFPNPNDDNSFYVIDRPFNGGPVKDERPSAEIGIISRDFKKYTDLGTLIEPRPGKWDAKRVGVNTPPIKTNLGNLFFYHGVEDDKNIYKMGFFISEYANPKNIIYRSEKPIIFPTEYFEIGLDKAEVPNVVFGCGAIPYENQNGNQFIRFFYSGADKFPAYADIKIRINDENLRFLDPVFKTKTK